MNELAVAWDHGVEVYYSTTLPQTEFPVYGDNGLQDAFWRGWGDADWWETEGRHTDPSFPDNPYLEEDPDVSS